MYTVRKVHLFQIGRINRVARILDRCGKDMAEKYDLHHWHNPHLKNLLIVVLCALKNRIYLVYDDAGVPIATFQTKQVEKNMRFEKLATDPSFSGKGVGSFCMNTIEEMAKAAGCGKVCMEVYDKSAHALRFYENRGYTVCGTVDTLKYTEIKMEKKL
ncbi:MAG: GNAT family N-acetyltransferase [Ruminococcaceae bacterium]|nr:GNAT family N-acetyltransferase [Oscillospiraceae bacterium]